eukprot:NODE_802_length_1770_cov_8.079024_g656_i0.p1 GENE.NODE_802_length_1770_cov_8.079024_g656_i0~~NODE_802_length_1770_cov_8.079024_g656_i0.p1  ORF type:complete len:541 (+),score=72.01 NODE_802_length_1770_cov_8.079024_g656_i0:196-1623(+)
MDLLEIRRTNLNIREDPRCGVFVENLVQVVVKSREEVMKLLSQASKNRCVSATKMNRFSSRSHAVIMLAVERCGGPDASGAASFRRGMLTFVDLAGSERVAKSGSHGARLTEAKIINRSLAALGNCVSALTESSKRSYIPFRDSKLTRLLTDSLGGNSKTCMCATIAPTAANYDETVSTLLFATRAVDLKNSAVINESYIAAPVPSALGSPGASGPGMNSPPESATQVSQLKNMNERLMHRLSVMEGLIHNLILENSNLMQHQTTLQGGQPPPSLGAGPDASGHPSLQPSALLNGSAPRSSSGSQSNSGPGPPPVPTATEGMGDMCPECFQKWMGKEQDLFLKFQQVIAHLQNEVQTLHGSIDKLASQKAASLVGELSAALLNTPAWRSAITSQLGSSASADPSTSPREAPTYGDRSGLPTDHSIDLSDRSPPPEVLPFLQPRNSFPHFSEETPRTRQSSSDSRRHVSSIRLPVE